MGGEVVKGEVTCRYRLNIVQKWQDLCFQDL